MSCCGCSNIIIDKKVYEQENKILLMGNPNVGKSVVFSALTGVHVMSSNYAGTTVSYTKANIQLEGTEYQLIDVPGTYSLNANSQAEEVAISFMNSGAKAVVCVLDATNLTRNLNLALEIKKYNIPLVYLLNLSDIAQRKGITIDVKTLEEELGAKVIETVAVKQVGFEELTLTLGELLKNQSPCSACPDCKTSTEVKEEVNQKQENLWMNSEEIVKKCVTKSQKSLSFIDELGDKMVKPMPGVPLAILMLILSLGIIVGGGKALRAVLFIPLINNGIVPIFKLGIGAIGLPTMLENILIGEMGIFVIGFEWIFSLLLPYVMIFYVVFTFLEDSGVLPRMSVLFDGVMRKMGVQGGSLISLVMGYGCAVPAIIGTRNATTRKERIIITSMVCFAVPCISQSVMMIALLGSYSYGLVLAMFLFSFFVVALVGFVTGKMLKGTIDPIVIEIPNLLIPEKKAYAKKLMIRLKEFLIEAEGPMLIAIVITAVFKETGLLDMAAKLFEPIVSGLLGLPKDAVIGLLLGIIRREMALAPFLDLPLSGLQLFVGGVVALLYLPCLSVIGVLAKEFNAKVAFAIGAGTFVTAITFGAVINFVGNLIF